MLTRNNLFLFPLVAIILSSCGTDKLDVDASDIKIDVKYEDMRSKLFKSKGNKLLNTHKRYQNEMPDIYNYFLGACMEFPQSYTDSVFLSGMEAFQKDNHMKSFEKEIDKKFNDLKSIEATLNDGFKHLKYHVPNIKLPKCVVFMNTLFRSSVWCTDNEVGIGLGNYLGEKSKTVSQLNPQVFYQWIKKAMNKDFLERDVAENWIRTHVIEENQEGNLIERIVQEGKIMYFTKAAFPEMEDHLILRYEKKQWEWAEKNEYAFWKYLVDNKMLFKAEEITIMNLLNPGPKTPGLPIEGSPDRLGQYLGYKIVLDYMENTDTTVKKLIDIPYQEIINEYEPEE